MWLVEWIDGKYKILQKLGAGFGGSVYLVEYRDKKIALKQLKMPEAGAGLSQEEIQENFKQEFSTLKNLNHPHILRILDFGYDAEADFYYFTTEYIEGKDIFQATRQCSFEEIEDLFVQTLRALSYLHSHKVYHLDIKPANIMVTKDNGGSRIAKVIDFGLSAFQKKGFLSGTPGFIAPEALLEEPLDNRADLYSLGATWYTCIDGRNPFMGKDILETLQRQKSSTPPPVSNHVRRIPSYIDPILEKLMRKNPTVRYHHADQVVRDINWTGNRHYPLETDATALAYLPGEGQLIGRKEQWSQLINIFDRVFVTHTDLKCGVVVSGSPGTGKSRLLKELKYYAQLHAIPVLEEKESLKAKIDKPCLILVDDADEDCFTLMGKLMLLFGRHPLMMVLAGRPPKTDSLHHIILKNFDRQEVGCYIASVLGMSNPPHFLTEELFIRTDGNPLFLTELLQSLIQSHQLFDEYGRWSPSRIEDLGIDFNKLEAPKTLQEHCREKYQFLPDTVKKILLAVSVSKSALTRHDLFELGLGGITKEVAFLQGEKLVNVDAEGTIRLSNPNFYDWIRQEVDPQELPPLHQSLGELLQRDPKRELFAFYHLGLGIGASEERLRHLLKYEAGLFEQHLWGDSIKGLEIALPLASNGEEQVEVRLRLVRSLFRSGQHHLALENLTAINQILKKEKENPKHWRWVQQTLREMGSIYIKEGKLDLAHESLEASRVLLEEHEENPVEEMILENFKASLLLLGGKITEAAHLSEETYQRWQSWSFEDKRRVLNNDLPNIYINQKKFGEAKKVLALQTKFYEEIGELQKQAYALYGLALCCYHLQEYEEALKNYQSCAEISRKIKNEELLFHVFNELGNISFVQKDWNHAVDHYNHALELAQHLSAINNSIGITINLALVMKNLGDFQGARVYLKHVIDSLETHPTLSLPLRQFLTQAYLALGKINIIDTKFTESRDAYRDAFHLIREHSALEPFRFSILLGLVHSNILLGRDEEAQEFLAELNKRERTPKEESEIEEIKQQLEKNLGREEFRTYSSLF
jgi:serine/threonine protein kinase/tetratricopeptide (TPR) repeat protein